VKTYQHHQHYSTPLLINEGNKKRMNIFVRKYHGGLESTEKEEPQELWTTPMKTIHQQVQLTVQAAPVILYGKSSSHYVVSNMGGGTPTVLDRRCAPISTLHSVTSTHPGNLANKRLSIDSKTQHQQESLADHGSNKSTSI